MTKERPSPSKVRVVHVTTVHQPFDPRIFYKQLGSVRDAGFDAHLVAPYSADETCDGVTIHALPVPENRLQRILLQPQAFRRAVSLDGDLYQIHDPELLPMAFLLQKWTGAAVVYDMHENYRSKGGISGWAVRSLERWSFSWLDHVLVAEESYSFIANGHSVDVSYIPNYVLDLQSGPSPDQSRAPQFPDDPHLLYSGTISDGRGLETMMDLAAESLRQQRPMTLELVGICRYEGQRTRAERRIERGGLSSVVHRVGWDSYVRPPDLWERYKKADVGLALFEPHSNYRESIPTKFYECLHFGVPLLCSDFPLWRKFVEQHECGVVVPAGDPSAVLDVLDEWHKHPDRYQRLAENAQEASSQYRWEPIGERVVGIYRDLVREADTVP